LVDLTEGYAAEKEQKKTIHMNSSEDVALVVSVHVDLESRTLLHQNVQDRAVRLNLKWQGKHDIGDFNLDRFGRLVECETETEHTGWALIEPRHNIKPGDTIPLRQNVRR
jgi:hypothetical protein